MNQLPETQGATREVFPGLIQNAGQPLIVECLTSDPNEIWRCERLSTSNMTFYTGGYGMMSGCLSEMFTTPRIFVRVRICSRCMIMSDLDLSELFGRSEFLEVRRKVVEYQRFARASLRK